MDDRIETIKPILRGSIIAFLSMNLVENFEIGVLGYSMVVYAMLMKSFNVVARQVKEFENA